MSVIFFIICLILILGYVYLIVHIYDGWDKIEEWELKNHTSSSTPTIIVPARNEEENIAACVESISASLRKNGPGGELLVVNDHSEDETENKARNAGAKIITLWHTQGKKEALELAVSSATHEIIICTDADSTVSESWVKTMVSKHEIDTSSFIAGPLLSKYNDDRLSAFQSLDALMMVATTANGILRKSYFLANGANMSFTKEAYNRVGGMKTHDKLASGDDVFLIQSIAIDNTDSVHYIKSPHATVWTEPVRSWGAMWQQRKRWSTKTRHYPHFSPIKIQAYVFLIHFIIILGIVLIPFTGGLSFFSSVFMLFIKWIMDYLLLSKIARYFDQSEPLKYFFSCSLIYFFYIFLMAFWALRGGSYTWKGRNTK